MPETTSHRPPERVGAGTDQVADRVISEVKRLRDLSPLYEMAREGVDLKTYFAGMTH